MTVGLGQKVRDRITGFEGIVVARTEWMYGCIRITIQPRGLTDDGKPIDSHTFDEPQLEVLADEVIYTIPSNKPDRPVPTGGGRESPSRAPDPERS